MVERGKVDTLEQGNIYFFYRPKIGMESPQSLQDIERFYVVLSPEGKSVHRLLIVGRKKLPETQGAEERNRFWGYVEKVAKKPKEITDELGGGEYDTETRGQRKIEPSRPVGEGVYRILRHSNHTHLAYSLELPKEPKEVQEEFNIEKEASYVITIKNPETPSPRGMGRGDEDKPEYPKELQSRFANRRFFDADPPDFLDYENTNFILIGAQEDVSEELGINLNAEDEREDTAEIFNELHFDRSRQPVEPLLKGEWR
jgi:hypothetical protein